MRVFNYVIFKILKCKRCKEDKRYFSGNRIKMERAAEPTDIYWENFSVVTIQRVKKSVLTYITTIFLLGVSFTVNLVSARLQTNLEKQASKFGFPKHCF